MWPSSFSSTAISIDVVVCGYNITHFARYVKGGVGLHWWDGHGYPDRLGGEAIPLEARILAVCDAVEAMASGRPYHRAFSLSDIMAELRRCAGTQFDPMIVEKFVRVAERQGAHFVINSAREIARYQAAAPSREAVPTDSPFLQRFNAMPVTS